MVVHTILEICTQDGTTICSYKTKRFTGVTKQKDIDDFLLKKYPNYKLPFNIKIRDQHHGYVTSDNDYLEEYNPFDHEKKNATMVQPINSSEKTVRLRVTLPGKSVSSKLSLFCVIVNLFVIDNISNSPIDQQNMLALEQSY